MRKIDDEIQALLLEHRGDIRSILKDNHRLDLLYALSSQRELLLEWYDFEPEAEVLQVGADYGALTGLFRSSVRAVTVLDDTESALETVKVLTPIFSAMSTIRTRFCIFPTNSFLHKFAPNCS